MKKTLPILMLILFLGCLGSDSGANETLKNTTLTTIDNTSNGVKVAEIGKIVVVNYIMRAEGSVVETTIEDLAKSSSDFDFISSLHPFGFEPATFIIGSRFILPEISEATVGMQEGDSKTFVLPSDNPIGGEKSENLIRSISKFTILPVIEPIPRQGFNLTFGFEPYVGAEVQDFRFWNSTILEVTNETVVFQHQPEHGSTFEYLGGNITISLSDETISMEFIPRINYTFRAADGTFITVIDSNDTHITADYNHPLAGKDVEVELILEEISDPIIWLTGLHDSTSLSAHIEKPVFVLFTNLTCIECRRIQGEALTHMFTLALKDEFVWTEIDIEQQPEVAEQFGVETLPTVIILKKGEEKTRITNFLPPQAMRAMLNSVLEEN